MEGCTCLHTGVSSYGYHEGRNEIPSSNLLTPNMDWLAAWIGLQHKLVNRRLGGGWRLHVRLWHGLFQKLKPTPVGTI
eukprot:1161282-Pelagomonas_calceolata.AAC.1